MQLFPLLSTCLLSGLAVSTAERIYTSHNNTKLCEGTNPNHFSASHLSASLIPTNNTLAFDLSTNTTIAGNITLEIKLISGGKDIYTTKLDPCLQGIGGLCPLSEGVLDLPRVNFAVPDDALADLPESVGGFVYMRLYFFVTNVDVGPETGCIEAAMTDGNSAGTHPSLPSSVATNGTGSSGNGSGNGDDDSGSDNSTNSSGGDDKSAASAVGLGSMMTVFVPLALLVFFL